MNYCGHCAKWHEPNDGWYFGPTYDCYEATPPAEKAMELVEALITKVAKLENTVWAICKKLDIDME